MLWPAADTLAWATGGSEQMRLTSTGLGIGTSSPAGKLDNRGVSYLGSDSNNALYVDSTSTLVTIGAAGRSNFSTSALRFLTSDGTASLERMRLDSSGNLGLGVTPSAWFSDRKVMQLGSGASVNGSAATSSFVEFGANFYQNASSSDVYIASSTASKYRQLSGVHSWYTAPSGTAGNTISWTQAMTLDASGNLGIGNTSPVNKLDVLAPNTNMARFLGPEYAQVQFSDGTRVAFIQVFDNQARLFAASNTLLAFGTNNIERARIPAAGGMVVGTAALATNATDGFLYVPTCAGTPTGTPTTQTGTAPIVINTTNNKLYFYSGGAWRDAGP
jgi:hypothetical protein